MICGITSSEISRHTATKNNTYICCRRDPHEAGMVDIQQQRTLRTFADPQQGIEAVLQF